MKSFVTMALALIVSMGVMGCEKKSVDQKKTETTIKSDDGSTTTKQETTVEKKGDQVPDKDKK